MSKIATYLNEHLMGEVVSGGPDIAAASVDGSVLLQKPEMIAHVANTSDIRKIARFCWQLAEKGHVLSVTARGDGTDMTGAAIGSGIIINPSKYMNRIIGIDGKQRLIHVQSGAPYLGVNMTLSTHKGLTLPNSSFDSTCGSVGGTIASGAVGLMNHRYSTVGKAVQQLEVVLANGDVLQTGRISRRELNSKKGLHTMEGEIYRQVDNLISDNVDLIQSIGSGVDHDTSGYSGIAEVRRKDGSMDLTPLFVGSQGSLGIITEVIMQAEFQRQELSVVLAAYSKISDAQAAADMAVAAKAVSVELIDGRILEQAAAQGKKRDFAPKECYKGALVVAIFDDFAERTRDRAAKRLQKQLEKDSNSVSVTYKSLGLADLPDVRSVLSVALQPAEANKVVPGVFRGIWLSAVRLDGFLGSLKKLEAEYKIQLPAYVDVRSGLIELLPVFDMKKVSDRQKLVKLLTEVARILGESGGTLSGQGGDGRLKAAATQAVVGDDVKSLFAQIKQIFDPHNILNPGVKQGAQTKDLVAQLNAWCRNLD